MNRRKFINTVVFGMCGLPFTKNSLKSNINNKSIIDTKLPTKISIDINPMCCPSNKVYFMKLIYF